MTAAPATIDTIAAIATPRGAGGIGVIRISGPAAPAIAATFLGRAPTPRHAHYAVFRDAAGEALDEGLLVYFAAPKSFTGEDVVELQGHGSDAALGALLRRCGELGARPARPGEFSERAYLSGRIDLTRAEAIADLISAQSEAAARAAVKSLQGAFAERVQTLFTQLVELRVWIEAALDFPEEEIDFLADRTLHERAARLLDALDATLAEASRGRRLNDGLDLVLAGRPNAGKSSLLNALAGFEAAIVTPIAGTTRDLLRERIQIDGLPLNLTDSAGLREAADLVEAEGIRRAEAAIARADHVLLLIDSSQPPEPDPPLPPGVPVTRVHTKIDLSGLPPRLDAERDEVWLSAKSGAGLDLLRRHLLALAGFTGGTAGSWSARQRHVDALTRTRRDLDAALLHLADRQGELAAEALRLAQEALAEITGRVSSDELLGRIFAGFCIGK